MTKELEDLEKTFILDEDMEHADINKLIGRILKFCKIDNKGYVILQKGSLIILDKIMLVLSARYLANKLQQKLGRENPISEQMNTKEIAEMIKEKDAVVAARLKELKDAKKALSPKTGVYKIAPYAIDEMLDKLEHPKEK
jgi:hypothetical protein